MKCVKTIFFCVYNMFLSYMKYFTHNVLLYMKYFQTRCMRMRMFVTWHYNVHEKKKNEISSRVISSTVRRNQDAR